MEENPLRYCGSRLHLAAASRVFQSLPGDPDYLVTVAFDATKINILDRIVRPRHRPDAARTVDFDFLQRAVERLLVAEAAPDRCKPAREQKARVVPLHRVNVGLHAIFSAVRITELLVLGVFDPVAVMQGRQQPLRRSALCLEGPVGEKSAAVERNLVLEP